MSCPNCGSSNYGSNKIDIASFEQIARVAHVARSANHPAAAIGALALWGGIRATNALRKAYCCNMCGHKFDA